MGKRKQGKGERKIAKERKKQRKKKRRKEEKKGRRRDRRRRDRRRERKKKRKKEEEKENKERKKEKKRKRRGRWSWPRFPGGCRLCRGNGKGTLFYKEVETVRSIGRSEVLRGFRRTAKKNGTVKKL